MPKMNEAERVKQQTAETETQVYWLDDDAPSLSWCHVCQHRVRLRCSAYPEGIPYHWLHGFDQHNFIQHDQTGTAVFKPVDSTS